MNIYKYAKKHVENRLDFNLIMETYTISKEKQRLLMIHWLSWYLKFKRKGNEKAAKDQLRYVIEEAQFLSMIK